MKKEFATRSNERGIPLYFESSDLGLVSALVSIGWEIKSIDKTDRKKVKFIFPNSEELSEMTEKYWNKELEIDARTFFEDQKMLKNRIYSK